MPMKIYQLSPVLGWNKFTDNVLVSKYIYSELMPLVNSQKLKYDNFVEELGIFSSEDGFCSIEFLDYYSPGEMEILVDLIIRVNSTESYNVFESLISKLKNKFGLVECLQSM